MSLEDCIFVVLLAAAINDILGHRNSLIVKNAFVNLNLYCLPRADPENFGGGDTILN